MKRTYGKSLLWLFVAAGLALCMMVGLTAAYFTDRIEAQASHLETGTLYFQYPEQTHGLIADFTALDARTEPYQEGDTLRLQLKAWLSGTASALAVPRLIVTAEGGSESDRIEVRAVIADSAAETGQKLVSEQAQAASAVVSGKGQLIYDADIVRMEPESEATVTYELSVVSLAPDSDLRLSFDFDLAAVQEKYNEAASEKSPTELFEAIAARYEGRKPDLSAALFGFTDCCTLARAVDQNGAAVKPGDRDSYRIELKPEIVLGNPVEGNLTWYESRDGSETVLRTISLQEGTAEDMALQLVLNGKNLNGEYRYEVQNEAGIQPSPVFRFRLSDTQELVCESLPFEKDLSGR